MIQRRSQQSIVPPPPYVDFPETEYSPQALQRLLQHVADKCAAAGITQESEVLEQQISARKWFAAKTAQQ